MLTSLDVKNFQSLKDVHLDLGLLTVIVGNSNSGKSASVRALKAMANNVRGSSCITQGFKAASVTVSSDDFKITLEKSEGTSSYRVCVVGEPDKEYTKLAGDTPEDVTKLLGMSPIKDGLSINFAGQHDSPFLLTSSGASVARILGELTNVITVFEAVREANRRRTSASGDLKLRDKDLTELETKIRSMQGLKLRAEAFSRAESKIQEIEKLDAEILDLSNIVQSTELYSDITVPEQIDIDSLVTQYELTKNLHSVISDMVTQMTIAQEKDKECQYQTELSGNLDNQLHSLLETLGMCPLCERSV